mgnify:CR=1 FL=1|jgi:hypothetical protein
MKFYGIEMKGIYKAEILSSLPVFDVDDLGRLVYLSTDDTLYLNNGTEYVVSATKYIHTQTIASATWTITHNLGSQYVSVICVDATDKQLLPAIVTFTDITSLIITFSSAISGKAIIIG